MNTFDKITEATAYLSQFNGSAATIGIILGSGLGDFTKGLTIEHEIPYEEIPYFPVSTVKGHGGKLVFGTVEGKPVIAMAGRFHFYEGYAPEEVVFPVRVMKSLGIRTVLLSNAAGGVNPNFKVGDLMVITDHISLATVNPLLGRNDDRLGPRFPDMSEPYKKELIQKARSIAQKEGIRLQEGVYFGVTGPTFETRAEYRMIHAMGGDAVGMSTVQEVITAVHAGMDVFAMSVITDIGIREEENNITHEEVLQAAKEAEPNFTAIFRQMIASL